MKNEEKYNLTTTFFFIGIFSFPFLMALGYLSLFLSFIFFIKELVKKNTLGNLVKSQLDYMILVFFTVSILSLVNLIQPYGNFEGAYTGVLRIIMVTICYFIAKNVVNHNNFKRIIWLFLIQSSILAVYGVIQFAFHGFTGRVSSFTDNPNILPDYFIISTPFIITMLFWPLNKLTKRFVIFTLISTIVSIFLTFSRGGWLGFLVSITFITMLTYKKLFPWLLTVGMSAVALIVPYSIMKRNDSNLQRLDIWRSAWRMFQDHPILGIGLSQFRYLYPSYILPPWNYIHSHAHNIFFQRFVELGLLGGAVFLALIFIVVRSAWQYLMEFKDTTERMFLISCLAGLLGILFHGLFDDPMSTDGTFILTWIVLGFFDLLRKEKLEQ